MLKVRLAEQLGESNVTAEVVSALMALRTKAAADQDANPRIDLSQASKVSSSRSSVLSQHYELKDIAGIAQDMGLSQYMPLVSITP